MPSYLGSQYPLSMAGNSQTGYSMMSSPGGFQMYLSGRGNTPTAKQRWQQQAQGQGAADAGLFDADGLPTRPPRNAQEAIQFQFMAAQAARKMQEQRVGQAINTLKYGMGLALRSSPYSMSAMQTPYLRDMANANLSVQYQQPDYSYFLRPDAYGQGQGQGGGVGGGGLGGGGGGGQGVRPIFNSPLGISMGPTPGIANYNPFADNPVYPRSALPAAAPANYGNRMDFETAMSNQPGLGSSLGRAGDWGSF